MTVQEHKIAFVVASEGIEQVELTEPWQAVLAAGGVPRLLGPQLGTVRGFNHLTPADEFTVDVAIADAEPSDYHGLVLPGGVANADELRTIPAAVAFVRTFAADKKPIAAICHAPWLLIEADIVRDKTVTSFPSLATDLRNAGATWVDKEMVHCQQQYPLVTSRNPGDLPAFNRAAVEIFGLST